MKKPLDKSTSDRTNPAKRLLTVFEEAQKHGDNEATLDVWQSVLGGKSLLTTINRVAWLDRQFNETEEQIRRIRPSDREHYLEGFVSLRKVTDPKLFNQHWSHVKGYMTPVLLTRLHFCSLALDEHGGELKIEDETLKGIQRDVEELLNEVLGADLPTSLKDLIVRLLQTIQSAIVEYRLGGVAALEERLESVVGALYLKPEILRDNDEPRVKRLLQIVGNVFRVLQTVHALAALGADASKVVKALQEASR